MFRVKAVQRMLGFCSVGIFKISSKLSAMPPSRDTRYDIAQFLQRAEMKYE